jgi:hypothetical protein
MPAPWRSINASITLVSQRKPKIVIPVTNFRDEGHLSNRSLERRCGWNVTVVSAFQLGICGKGEVRRVRWALRIFTNQR